jgi:hypothetical protein
MFSFNFLKHLYHFIELNCLSKKGIKRISKQEQDPRSSNYVNGAQAG